MIKLIVAFVVGVYFGFTLMACFAANKDEKDE